MEDLLWNVNCEKIEYKVIVSAYFRIIFVEFCSTCEECIKLQVDGRSFS